MQAALGNLAQGGVVSARSLLQQRDGCRAAPLDEGNQRVAAHGGVARRLQQGRLGGVNLAERGRRKVRNRRVGAAHRLQQRLDGGLADAGEAARGVLGDSAVGVAQCAD